MGISMKFLVVWCNNPYLLAFLKYPSSAFKKEMHISIKRKLLKKKEKLGQNWDHSKMFPFQEFGLKCDYITFS